MHGCGIGRFHVLTYNVGTAAVGLVDLPSMDLLPESYRETLDGNPRLAASPEPNGGLSLIVRDRMTVCVWRQLATGDGWVKRAVIDTEAALRSLSPELPQQSWQQNTIQFTCFVERSSVLLFHLSKKKGLLHLTSRRRRCIGFIGTSTHVFRLFRSRLTWSRGCQP
ncbi:unnamed protein product [Urochloa humidicola]